jgi:glycosyltransferase involved in cell wall biosynthesis
VNTKILQPVNAESGVAPEDPLALTIVVPARNEAASIGVLVARALELHPDAELIVVDDASTDDTAKRAVAAGARVISHRYRKGNGASIKSGARVARGRTIVFMDGDGQHLPEDIGRLVEHIDHGNDMVIGARDAASQASIFRHTANWIYNLLATWMTGHAILDLTSGFRAVNARKFREFLFMLPNGFSYPTTITMAFFRSGYSVEYIPIRAPRRSGKSHLNVMRDGVKFLLIIFRVCTLYSPLKIFFPMAVLQLMLGLGYYAYTYMQWERFTNMSAVLFTGAIITFMFGLLAEQITTLIFRHEE